MFSIFTFSFLFFLSHKYPLFQRDPFNTTIPAIQQTLMKTVARHFSAVTFLSRHFQNLKHILNTVSQDLHIKNTNSFIENKSAKSEKKTRTMSNLFIGILLNDSTVSIVPLVL